FRRQLFEQRAAKSCLAGAHFAGELHKALALANPIQKVIQRLAMLGAQIKEARIRRNRERRFFQPIKLQISVHCSIGLSGASGKIFSRILTEENASRTCECPTVKREDGVS